jgi:hypothetical protein
LENNSNKALPSLRQKRNHHKLASTFGIFKNKLIDKNLLITFHIMVEFTFSAAIKNICI